MLLNIFSIFYSFCCEEFNDEEDFIFAKNNSSIPIKNQQSLNYEIMASRYPYPTAFIYMHSRDYTDPLYITQETTKILKLVRGVDYDTCQNTIFFKTSDQRNNFCKVGYDLQDEVKAAMTFRDLDKRQMGVIAFSNDNKFYISVRPKSGKENELLEEVTSFYKGNGY